MNESTWDDDEAVNTACEVEAAAQVMEAAAGWMRKATAEQVDLALVVKPTLFSGATRVSPARFVAALEEAGVGLPRAKARGLLDRVQDRRGIPPDPSTRAYRTGYKAAESLVDAVVGLFTPKDTSAPPKVADVARDLAAGILKVVLPLSERMTGDSIGEAVWTAAITSTNLAGLPGGAATWAAVALLASAGGTEDQAVAKVREVVAKVTAGKRPRLRLVKGGGGDG